MCVARTVRFRTRRPTALAPADALLPCEIVFQGEPCELLWSLQTTSSRPPERAAIARVCREVRLEWKSG